MQPSRFFQVLAVLALLATPAFAKPPIVKSVTPSAGPVEGGTTVTINGKRFGKKAGSVSIAGMPCAIQSWKGRKIVCVTGAGPAGPADLVLTKKNGESTTVASAFTYLGPPEPDPPPLVTSVSPDQGPIAGRTQVVVRGEGFLDGAVVKFDGVEAETAYRVSSAEITCTTPAHDAGDVDVTVTNPGDLIGSLANAFTYFTPPPPSPTAGALDPSFGTGGIAVAGPWSNTDLQTTDSAVFPDGSLVQVGISRNVAWSPATGWAVFKLNADGSLAWMRALFLSASYPNQANGVAIDSSGRIVVTGHVHNGDYFDFVTIRLNAADGSYDASFGAGGIVTTSITPGVSDRAHAVAIQPDGRIVVAGAANFGSAQKTFAVVRYHPDGSLDASFGTTSPGMTAAPSLPSGNASEWVAPGAIAIDGSGRIVLGGWQGGIGNDWVLLRYLSNGSVDTSFGQGGIAVQNFPETNHSGGSNQLRDIAVQPDGKVVAVGWTRFRLESGTFDPDRETDITVTRHNADGSPDLSFAGNGRFYSGFTLSKDGFYDGSDWGRGVALDGDKIVIAGNYWTETTNFLFTIRLNANGTYDTSYGPNGDGRSADIPAGWDTRGADVLLHPGDGNYLIPFAIVRDSSGVPVDTGVAKLLRD